MHCIIAYAASHRLPPEALTGLPLPRLGALLARLQPAGEDRDDSDERPAPSLPHERAHARALGWEPAQALPWAAWHSGCTEPSPQAWITPCHWQIGMDQVFMMDPAGLQLDDPSSQALLQALQPYLLEDGLQLRWHDALHWHATGPLLGGWVAPSLDRVIGANVRPWITTGLPAALVRLQSEMQMLVYNHPVNDERLARGQLPVNAFWIHGAGSLPPQATNHGPVQCIERLRPHALRGDVQGWRKAWLELDAQLPEADTPGLQLTLCSESAARHWQALTQPWLSRLRRLFSAPEPVATLQSLLNP